jgi:S-(hydroxymethyl)glutathione dehydrogenase / alcohol dehydrogenase
LPSPTRSESHWFSRTYRRGAQILRDSLRFIRLAETGQLDLGSMISHRIKLDEINDGIEPLTRAEGVRTVVL